MQWGLLPSLSSRDRVITEEHLKAFGFGFLQVLLVALTTQAIVHHAYVANFILALGVNVMWLANVTTATKGSKAAKWLYAVGAAMGSVSGSLLGELFL